MLEFAGRVGMSGPDGEGPNSVAVAAPCVRRPPGGLTWWPQPGRAAVTAVNVAISFVLIADTEVTITTATRPAIRPYSSAVTPRSSLANARRLLRNVNILIVLAAVRGAPAASSREPKSSRCLGILPAG